MDPYLEHPYEWGGVHLSLVSGIQIQLNRVLPKGYRAKLDQYVWVNDPADEDRELLGRPEVFVPDSRHPPSENGVGVLDRRLTTPTVIGRLPVSKRRKQRVVQIVEVRGRRVVTVIELLSPANKIGDDRRAYLTKRREYLANVNFLEIDLLREGERMPVGRPTPPPADYIIFSCPSDQYPETRSWAFTVRDPLPIVPVTFSAEAPPVPLDLRPILDEVYDGGRFADEIDYGVPPVPALRPADAEWAAGFLKRKAKRRK